MLFYLLKVTLFFAIRTILPIAPIKNVNWNRIIAPFAAHPLLELSPNNFIKRLYKIKLKETMLKKIQTADEPARMRNAFEILVIFSIEAKIINAIPRKVCISITKRNFQPIKKERRGRYE